MGKCFEVGSACGISKKEIDGESKNEIVSSGFFKNCEDLFLTSSIESKGLSIQIN